MRKAPNNSQNTSLSMQRRRNRLAVFLYLKSTRRTRKSSCVNARGIPPAALQVLMLLCLRAGVGGVPTLLLSRWREYLPKVGTYPPPPPAQLSFECGRQQEQIAFQPKANRPALSHGLGSLSHDALGTGTQSQDAVGEGASPIAS